MGVSDADRFPFLKREFEVLKDRIESARPAGPWASVSVRSCLPRRPAQRVRPSGRHEIGWHPVELTEAGAADPLTAGLDWSAPVFHWHGDTFETTFGTGPGAAVHLLRSARFAQQGFRIGRARVWAAVSPRGARGRPASLA